MHCASCEPHHNVLHPSVPCGCPCHGKTASYSHILRDAASIADDREQQYGDATKNLTEIAELCNAMWGMEISASTVARIMIAVKFARERHMHKPDNLEDAINYTAILALLCEQESKN